jgi:Septum formation
MTRTGIGRRPRSVVQSGVLLLVFSGVGACASDDDSDVADRDRGESPTGDAASGTTATAATSMTTSTTSTSTSSTTTTPTTSAETTSPESRTASESDPNDGTQPPQHQTLYDSMNLPVSLGWGGTNLPQPDFSCFDAAVEGAPPATRAAVEQIENATEPFAWYGFELDVRKELATYYTHCVDLQFARRMLVMGMINLMEDAECIVSEWETVLDSDVLASMVAAGPQDMPDPTARALVGGVMTCNSMPQDWWVDDIALELEAHYQYTADQAHCVAERFVETFGFEPAIRHRVLTIPMLTLTDEEVAALAPDACGVTIEFLPFSGGSQVGECLPNLDADEVFPVTVPCDQPHIGEVIAVIDLSTIATEWPGFAALAGAIEEPCSQRGREIAGDRDDLGLSWNGPSRESWERGDRVLACVIGRLDGEEFDGPSGLAL